MLTADVPRNRVYTSTTYVFVLWMIGSSLVLLCVAALFLRNQVKSLRRLAAAADGFGKGRPVAFTKIEGALEVRQAARRLYADARPHPAPDPPAHRDARRRVARFAHAADPHEAGARNDAVATRSSAELKSDVAEMERLVNLYLDFARGEGTESPVETDIGLLIEDVAAAARRDGTPLAVASAAANWSCRSGRMRCGAVSAT